MLNLQLILQMQNLNSNIEIHKYAMVYLELETK